MGKNVSRASINFVGVMYLRIKNEKGERMRLLRCEKERPVLMDDRTYANTIPTFSNMCDEVVLIGIYLKR